MRAIDCLGKNDRHVASLAPDVSGAISGRGMTSVPGHNKYDLDYSLKVLEPTFVQYFSWGSQDFRDWGSRRYVSLSIGGANLHILKGSPDVDWGALPGP